MGLRNRMRRWVLPLAALLLSGLLFTSMGKTLDDQRRVVVKVLMGKESKNTSDFFVPQGGEWRLTDEIRTQLGLLRRHSVERFYFSPLVKQYHAQRIIETAYPIQLDPGAHFLLYLTTETWPGSCKLIEASHGFALVSC